MQALLALLQADWPLQEFTPLQWILASEPAASAVVAKPVPKSMAAAVATATPEFFSRMMVPSFSCFPGEPRAASRPDRAGICYPEAPAVGAGVPARRRNQPSRC